MSRLDTTKLKQITEANPTAQAIFEALKDRKRSRTVTDLRQFQHRLSEDGKPINSDQYIEFWKALDDVGVGSLIIRRNQPPRFKWGYTLKDVVKVTLGLPGESDNVVAIKRRAKKAAESIQAQRTGMNIRIVLERPDGREISFALPADLRREEAIEISNIIRGIR